jgi:hypothetical protein
MCDAVPGSDTRAPGRRAGGGNDLPSIGNARPQRTQWRAQPLCLAVIDRRRMRLSVRIPALPRGTAIAPGFSR